MTKIISQAEVKKVAKLARIKISLQEEEEFAKEINSILEYFKDISKVETSGRDRLDHFKLTKNQLRADQINDSQKEQKEATRGLFPQGKGNYLKVKEVLNNSE